MKYTTILVLLAGCTTKQPEIPQAQREFNSAVYNDLKTSEQRVIRLERRVFAKEIAEAEAKEKNQKKQ